MMDLLPVFILSAIAYFLWLLWERRNCAIDAERIEKYLKERHERHI